MNRRRSIRHAAIGAALAASLVVPLAACSSNGSGSGDGLILNVASQSDSLTQSFNPYLPNTAQGATYTNQGAGGFIYEPLVQINNVDIGHDIPWLAKSWEWSDENKTLTLHLQSGVKWTDGQKFSADDVVFTYELLKKYPALNVGGVDFDTITAKDPDTVVMTFTAPSETKFTSLVSAAIVSKHIWSKVGDPTKYVDKNPVGTGPFTLDTFSPQSFVLKTNKNYWQTPAKIGGRLMSSLQPGKNGAEILCSNVQFIHARAGGYRPSSVYFCSTSQRRMFSTTWSRLCTMYSPPYPRVPSMLRQASFKKSTTYTGSIFITLASLGYW